MSRKIRRSPYVRRSRSGKLVAVRSALIRDVGAPGKWRDVHKSRGIGSLRKGGLSTYGYSVEEGPEARHAALARAVQHDSALKVFRRLNAVATYTKRTSPGKSSRFLADRNYVRKTYM